jgi:methyl-accepting chemotaxis protein
MKNKKNLKGKKRVRQRHFVARELQFTIALLVVLALLGGIFLQSITKVLTTHFGFEPTALGLFLIIGYIAIVVLLAVFFSHRLVGPFKRLEYEMKFIMAGELSKRLSVRAKDDLHVRNFIEEINDFVANFEEMSKEYSKLNSAVSTHIGRFIKELSEKDCDLEKIKEELKAVQIEIHKFREKW